MTAHKAGEELECIRPWSPDMLIQSQHHFEVSSTNLLISRKLVWVLQCVISCFHICTQESYALKNQVQALCGVMRSHMRHTERESPSDATNATLYLGYTAKVALKLCSG